MKKEIKYFLIALVFSLPFWWGVNFFQKNLEDFFYAQISKPLQEITFVEIPKRVQKPKLELDIKSAFSFKINKADREKILFEKNSNEISPIASLTKLMTALIVLENPENYDFSKIVTISKEAVAKENVPEGGNLKEGDKITIEELLNLMLIYSSNDAAWALAEVIGVENFIERMNQKAEVLELNNTHFLNSTGLDPKNLKYSGETQNYFNYSTAKDLARFAQYILNEFPLIYEIVLKKPYYPVKNGLADLSLNQNIIGGKTGYTGEAGGCIVLILENEKGSRFINVILGAKTPEARILEMQKLIGWLSI